MGDPGMWLSGSFPVRPLELVAQCCMYVFQIVNAGLEQWHAQAGELHALSEEVFFVRGSAWAVSSICCFGLDVLLTFLS
jgi:hypothetical protein